MQHAWKHVERPGESHTALEGKKMTLLRHQDKLLQTPATLETLGSASAVHQDMLCLFKQFECLKTVETFQAPKRDS